MQTARKTGPTLAALAALAALAVAHPQTARAQTITFDDIPTGGQSHVAVPNGYQGFNWTNMYAENAPAMTAIFGPSGYANGVVSGTQAAFNGSANPAALSAVSGTFGLSSGYFTAAFNNPLSVTVTGLNGGATLFTKPFAVNSSGPTLETFNWTGLTSVSFASSGLTQFVMDNLTLIPAATPAPEPSTTAAFLFTALGAAALTLRARKRPAA